MAIGDYDALARASRVLRAAPEPGWSAIEQSVIEAVRQTPRAGWPIAVADPAPGSAPGRIRVSDLVVRTLVARQLTNDPDVTLRDVEVALDGETLQAVRIEVSGRFGSDLPGAAARVRALAETVVAETTGQDADVSVDVIDLHR
ncbi:hypothetical protein PDG61_16515 [Mycolicibacterium sp. BiH015]|uniref:hypothetical protein n=1 Tax=Mycolicibacterium sp. BiH015 TaxID=3018808 RepID=UPI0022DF0FC2|nr:hypothetical protein [Mycolicibacterium sp. BiH015]MDA2892526.1 hypothetical protein [Mycolicibacterium sp. BiH015]